MFRKCIGDSVYVRFGGQENKIETEYFGLVAVGLMFGMSVYLLSNFKASVSKEDKWIVSQNRVSSPIQLLKLFKEDNGELSLAEMRSFAKSAWIEGTVFEGLLKARRPDGTEKEWIYLPFGDSEDIIVAPCVVSGGRYLTVSRSDLHIEYKRILKGQRAHVGNGIREK